MATEVPRFVPARQDFIIPSLRPPVTHDFEHPEYINPKDFRVPLEPTPNYLPSFPYHLRKFVLRRIELETIDEPKLIAKGVDDLWHQRGDWSENRMMDLVSRIDGVQNVVRHKQYSQEDLAGKDLSFELDGLLMHVQAKSSRFAVVKFKHMIRDFYFPNEPNSEALVNNWLTENRIILVNGSETRSDNEILNNSFYPQLRKIFAREEELRRQSESLPNRAQVVFSATRA
jgi:hypothetical protein